MPTELMLEMEIFQAMDHIHISPRGPSQHSTSSNTSQPHVPPSTPYEHDEQRRRRAEMARLEAEEEYSAERKRQKRKGAIAALRSMDPHPYP